MRFYISADIEGAPGVVSRHQMVHGGFDYAAGRRWMTDMVSAASEALIEGGASEIVISDSHGLMQNILIDDLPDPVQVVRGFPRPLLMMDGIEHGRFDGALLLGYHTGHSSKAYGISSHTFSGAHFQEVRLDEVPASEAMFSALTAGHFGVPIIMIAGDDGFAAETHHFLPEVETAIYKWTYSDSAARTLTPRAASSVTKRSAAEALKRLPQFKPYTRPGPFTVEVDFKSRRPVEYLSYLKQFTRVGGLTIRFVAQDAPELCRIFCFLALCQFSSPGS